MKRFFENYRPEIITALVVLAFFAAWTFLYVVPMDNHRDRINACMKEKGAFNLPFRAQEKVYNQCHNELMEEAEGLVVLFHPTSG